MSSEETPDDDDLEIAVALSVVVVNDVQFPHGDASVRRSTWSGN